MPRNLKIQVPTAGDLRQEARAVSLHVFACVIVDHGTVHHDLMAKDRLP